MLIEGNTEKSELVVFNGIRFRRYFKDPKKYFWPTNTWVFVGPLHRAIWMASHGPIPKGCDIHHKDENPLNNDLSNLEMLTKAEHRKRHRKPPINTKETLIFNNLRKLLDMS